MLRDRLGLASGRVVNIREREGRLEIELTPTPMPLVTRRGECVAVAFRKIPPLTDKMVREVLEQSRR